MIRIFAGYDPREAVGYHVFCSSVIRRSSVPVSITPLHVPMLGKGTQRRGSNAFTFTRFKVPELAGYRGWAIFMDGSDMICNMDVAKLFDLRDNDKIVQVVKHEYQTRHPKKYVGTLMECANQDYERKNWASMMLINCDSWIAPAYSHSKLDMLQLRFIDDADIGELPAEYNWLADEHGDNPQAKIIHYTAGIPAFPNYSNTPMANYWFDEHREMNAHI